MTKLYKFEQTLDGYKEPYFQMTGTLEEIVDKWCHNNNTDHLWWCGNSCCEDLYSLVLGNIEKQDVFIEIVDESLYGKGWMTKIEEVEKWQNTK